MGEPVRQLVEAPIGQGLDQKTDARKAPLGTLVAGANFVIAKSGRLDKRWGHTSMSKALVGGGSLAAGARIATYSDELCLFNGERIYSYSPALASWVSRDKTPPPIATVRPVYSEQDGTSLTAPNDVDVAYGGGLLVYTWRVSTNIFSIVVDEVTGAIVMPRTQVNTTAADYAQVVVALTKVICIYANRVNGAIYGTSLDLTAPTAWVAEATLRSDYNTAAGTSCFDVCGTADGRVILAYTNVSGVAATSVTLVRYLSTLAVETGPTQIDGASVLIKGIAVFCGTTLWVATGQTAAAGDTKISGWSPTTLLTTVARSTAWTNAAGYTNERLGLVEISATQVVLCGDSDTQGINGRIRSRTYTTSATFTSAVTRESYWVQLLSRPFAYNGEAYALVYAHSIEAGTEFLLDLMGSSTSAVATTLRPVATIEPRQCPGSSNIRGQFRGVSHAPSITASRFVVPAASGTQLVIVGTGRATNASRIRGIEFDMADPTRWQPAEMGRTLSLSGGVPSYFDGRVVGEHAFLMYPDATYITAAGAAGVALGAGAYTYRLCYAFRDAKGQIHRSAPSTPYSVTIAGAQQIDFSLIPNLSMTTRADLEVGYVPQISIEIYRTTVGVSSPFYYVDSVTSDPTTLGTIYSDTTIDLTLVQRRTLYTDGGELDNVCPPSASIAIGHKNRVWLAGCDDPKVVWFSKAAVDGEGLGFHEDLTFRVDDGGAITALASMDDKLLVFKADRIFYMVGSGPSAAGTDSDLSEPQRIASDVGCIDPRSIVLTPMGLMFQSRAGLYLLTRGLELQYIGLDVEDALAANPTVTSAVLVAPQSHVRFTCNGSGSTGVTLIYDYKSKAWLQHKVWDENQNSSAQRVSACFWSGAYVSLGSNGRPYQESTTTCLDVSSDYVAMTLEFAPLSAGGTQGFQSVAHVLANLDYATAHTMTVSFAYDGEGYTESKAYLNAALLTLSREQLNVHPLRMKHAMLKVKLADSYVSGTVGTGRGYSCAGLSFEVVGKQGPQKNIASGAKG